MNQPPLPFWSLANTQMLQQLDTAKDGLPADEAKQRLARYGSNLLKPPKRSDLFTLLLAQFKSPITLILLCATGSSFGLALYLIAAEITKTVFYRKVKV
jgi:Mg2+-importing ATPase